MALLTLALAAVDAVRMTSPLKSSSASHLEGRFQDYLVELAQQHLQEEECKNGWCRYVNTLISDPAKLATLVLALYSEFTEVRGYFREVPPNINEAVTSVRLAWIDIVDVAVEDDYKQTNATQWEAATAEWNNRFTTEKILALNESGQDMTVPLLNYTIDTLLSIMTITQPGRTETWDMMSRIARAATRSYVGVQDGDWKTAALAGWKVFNASVWMTFNLEEQKDGTFTQVMLWLDTIVSTYMDFEANVTKQAENSTICLPPSVKRKFKERSICYPGFTLDKTVCRPSAANGADCGSICPNRECPEFCPENKRYCCKRDDVDAIPECRDARFVNLLFTNGTPGDYFQCVSPTVSFTSSLLQRRVATPASTQTKQRVSLDRSTSRKGGVKEEGESAYGTHKPECDNMSPFHIAVDDKCFEECPEGHNPDKEEPEECREKCQEPFPVMGNFSVQGNIMVQEVCAMTGADLSSHNDKWMRLILDNLPRMAITVRAMQKEVTRERLKTFLEIFSTFIVFYTRLPCVFSGT